MLRGLGHNNTKGEKKAGDPNCPFKYRPAVCVWRWSQHRDTSIFIFPLLFSVCQSVSVWPENVAGVPRGCFRQAGRRPTVENPHYVLIVLGKSVAVLSLAENGEMCFWWQEAKGTKLSESRKTKQTKKRKRVLSDNFRKLRNISGASVSDTKRLKIVFWRSRVCVSEVRRIRFAVCCVVYEKKTNK